MSNSSSIDSNSSCQQKSSNYLYLKICKTYTELSFGRQHILAGDLILLKQVFKPESKRILESLCKET